jgi:hexosaminidase
MRKIFVIIILTLLFIILNAQNYELNLMPVPAQVDMKPGKFRLTYSFKVAVTGNPHERIYNAATRMLRRLDGRTALFFTQDFLDEDDNDPDASLIIYCERPGKVVFGEDESYVISITAQQIILNAPNDIGAIRGMETLLQLLSVDEEGYYFTALEIRDKPRFAWRGLLLDVGRHFMPMEVIKRNIDGMAAAKMNVLHLHLTEDQGFRIESKKFPKLHLMGSDGLYFTQVQIKEIIKYANDRGIRVVPEVDMPGHATSWFVGYPELASAPGPYSIERFWGVMDPTINPTKEESYAFIDTLLAEMCHLFPDDYFHIGGDENNGKQWQVNDKIQTFMQENNIKDKNELQTYFNKNVLQILQKYNKRMMGWDEILQPDLPKEVMIQSWRGKQGLIRAAREGYPVILSYGYYIDLMQPTDYHYLNDPLPQDIELTEEQKKFVFGGEATMWSEFVTLENVDSRIWPRSLAVAERLWSPGSVKDVEDMYRRMEYQSIKLEELGLMHIKNYNMMLRRLTNGTDISALRILMDVIEPLKIYRRLSDFPKNHDGMRFTSFFPYTRVMDVANADAPVARNFRKMVSNFITDFDNDTLQELQYWLTLWRDNHQYLLQTIKISPILEEIESLSQDLSALGNIGLAALNYLIHSERPSLEWYNTSKEVIEDARIPRGQTELQIVSAVEKIVEQAMITD